MSFAKDVLLRNWGIKLTSVLLAFLLWLAVRGEPSAERVLTVPLEIILPTDMQVTSERPSTVEVTLRGAASSMWFGQPLPSCRLDLGQLGEGEHDVPLKPTDIRLPRASGLEVVSTRPARVRLTLEKTIYRDVPVHVIRGDPPLDLEVYGITVEPPEVTVSGPRSHLQGIRDIPTENISLSGQRESIRTYARLNIPDNLVHASPPGPIQVSIQLGVRRQLRIIRAVPVVPDDPSVAVIPPRITLRVLVPISVQETLSAADFEATVSTANLDPAQKTIRVKPEIRPRAAPIQGVAVVEVSPAEVTVRREGKK
jgi:YbbR domain-containing protein